VSLVNGSTHWQATSTGLAGWNPTALDDVQNYGSINPIIQHPGIDGWMYHGSIMNNATFDGWVARQ
jgi:hypothetical protein